MLTRRKVLQSAVGLAVASAIVPVSSARRFNGGTNTVAPTFDYYIGPSGSDANPGTIGSPWAITSLTTGSANYSSIASHKIGLLSGTYDISATAGDTYSVKLTIPSGTSGSPTVIQSVTPLAAIIVSNPSAGGYSAAPVIGNGANGEGSVGTPSYITLNGLTITGGTSAPASLGVSGVSFAGSSSESCPGIIIENCEIYNFINPNNSADIACIIFGTGPTGALVTNCKLHDCYTTGATRTAHQNSSGVHDWANGTIVQYCNFYNCNNAIYQKNQTATPPPGGLIARYNYIHQGSGGMGLAFAGFNNANGTSPPYTAQAFYNNVIENTQAYYQENIGDNYLQSPTALTNNTFICTVLVNDFENSLGMWVGPTTGAPWNFLTFSNNIGYTTQTSWQDWGALSVGPTAGDWTRIDYNAYNASATFGIASNDGTPPGSLLSFATWKTQTGTPDTHSITSDPLMVFEETSYVVDGGGAQCKLQSGSPCKGTGYGSIDMGAWGGTDVNTGLPIAQIGSNF